MAWTWWRFWCALSLLVPACAAACALRLPLINLAAAKPGAPRTGFDLELADAITREAGCELVISDGFSRPRRDLMFSLGQADLILAATQTPEREQIARFSLPYRMEVVRLFVLQARRGRYDGVRGFDDVLRRGDHILVPDGGWYGPAYAAAQPALQANARLVTFKTFDQGMRMLDAARADLIMGDALGVQKAADRAGLAIAPLDFIVLRDPVRLMLNRATISDAILQRLNAAIGRLEANGTLRTIRHRYCDVCDP
ncbi:MAG: substrate-binding periplasmic protein [Telluria sp.]